MARALLFGPDDLFNPELVCSDFGHLNPTNMPGWVAGLLDYLDEYGAALPLNLLRPGATGAAQADGVAPTTAGGAARKPPWSSSRSGCTRPLSSSPTTPGRPARRRA